jgi:hypothetical protein
MVGCVAVACLAAFMAGHHFGYGRGMRDGIAINARVIEIDASKLDLESLFGDDESEEEDD